MNLEDYTNLIKTFNHFYILSKNNDIYFKYLKREMLLNHYKNESLEHKREFFKYLKCKAKAFRGKDERC